MHRRSRSTPIVLAIVAIVVGACGSGAAPTLAPSYTVATPPTVTSAQTIVPTAVPDPIAQTEPTPTPKPTPTLRPTPKPTPKPAPAVPVSAAGWTTARALIDSVDCHDVTAAVDPSGGYQLAATCGDSIRAYASTGPTSWSTRLFVHPIHRAELAPQIAIAGNVEYVAYYRIAPDGGCGSLGTDVGVYFRSRTLPNGAWSVATKVGAVADELESLAATGSTIFLTVRSSDGLYFETRTGSSVHRSLIPGAGGQSSVAVGSDGRARVVYPTATGLRLGIYTGSSLSSSRIGGSTGRDWAPKLVLDSADKPHVVWTRSPAPGGCAGPGPNPDDGTYYGTSAGGSWVDHRITTATGPATFDMNDADGRAYAVVSTGSGLRCYTGASNGTWSGVQVVTTRDGVDSPVVRFNDVTGTLFIAFVNYASGRPLIYTLSKP
jgi:hypothetical protein